MGTIEKTGVDWVLRKKLLLMGLLLMALPSYVNGAPSTGIYEADNESKTESEFTVTTSDYFSGNDANKGAYYAKNNGTFNLSNGTINYDSGSHAGAVMASDGGTAILDGVNINSTQRGNADFRAGIYAFSGGRIEYKNGKITTEGTYGPGVWASNGGLITVSNSTIETTGVDAPAVYVGKDATVTLNDTDINTTGSLSYGISTLYEGSKVIMNGGTITTSGTHAASLNIAAYSFNGGYIELNDVAVTTKGERSPGLATKGQDVNGKGSEVKMTGGSITTEADFPYGAYTNANTTISLKDVGVETQGEDSYGIYSVGNTVVTDSVIKTSGSRSHGVYANTGGTVTLNGSTITVDDSKGSKAIYTAGTGDIQGSGVYDITGDIVNSGNGTINLGFESGSQFTGGSDIGSGSIAVNMHDSSNWDMTKSSTLTNLDFSGAGIVQFNTGAGYGTLTTDQLSGNGGTFSMRTNIAGDGLGVNNQGDMLIVNGASSGDHFVHVLNNGSAATDGSELLTIVKTSDGVATFALDNKVEAGGYEYWLRRTGADPTDWELYSTGGASSTTDAGVNLFSGSYLLNYAETQTLLKRLGDLRDGEQEKGIWARGYGGKFSSASDGFLHGFDMSYWGIQAGYDKKFERDDKKGTVYVGGFLGYSKGNLDYLENGSGSVESKSLGAYWTHIHRNGFYADAVFKYNWMKNDFKHLDSEGTSVRGDDINTRGFTGSLEVGRRYFFDKTDENGEKLKVKDRQGWYVEPQLQLTVGHQNGAHFTASNGLRIKADSYRSVMGRVEAHLGYEVKKGKNPINLYGKLGVVKEFDGDVDYYLNGSQEQTSYKDTWKVWGFGMTAQFKQKHNLYLEIERATGGKFTQDWGINGGYRFTW